MANGGSPEDEPEKPWTRNDEENLLLDVAEDSRLQRLGIDPDTHPLLVMLELRKKKAALEAERAARQNAKG